MTTFKHMMNKCLFILLLLTTAMGCGKKGSDETGILLNSMYLNIQNNLSGTETLVLFNQDVDDFDFRVREDILFRPPYRPTTIAFGNLSSGILGLTECEYKTDGSSSCKITISNVLDPDSRDPSIYSPSTQSARMDAFQSVVRHEIGHAFGLGHIKNNPDHVMSPFYKWTQIQDQNIANFILDLNNFRINGAASGLPTIQSK